MAGFAWGDRTYILQRVLLQAKMILRGITVVRFHIIMEVQIIVNFTAETPWLVWW